MGATRHLFVPLLAWLLACGARSGLDDDGLDGAGLDAGGTPHDASADRKSDQVATDPDAAIHAECLAEAVTILATTTGPTEQIALDASHVYFHDGAGVSRLPKGGGPPTLIAPDTLGGPGGAGGYSGFALDSNDITWGAVDYGKPAVVRRVPKQGGVVMTVANVGGPNFYLVAPAPGGATYAWQGSLLGLIGANGGLKQLSNALPYGTGMIAVDGNVLYTASQYGVFRYDGVGFQEIADIGDGFVNDVAFDLTDLYFSGGVMGANGGGVWRVSKSGGLPTLLASGERWRFRGIAVDGAHAYVGEINGDVVRMDKDGGSQAVIGTSITGEQAIGVGVDDRCVYWAATTNGVGPSHVYAAPK